MNKFKNRETSKNSARQVTFLGLLFGVAVTLSYLENIISAGLLLPAGVKIGLSNIVVMYTLFFFGKPSAYILAVLKAAFVFILRGSIAGLLSLSGGLISLTIIILLRLLSKEAASFTLLSISGAIAHNAGQIIVVAVLMNWGMAFVVTYLPVLLVSGVCMGILTAAFLRSILPALARAGMHLEKKVGKKG